MAPVAQALSRDPLDRVAQLARAVLLQKYGMLADANAEYQSLAAVWEGALWTRGAILPQAPQVVPQLTAGKIYAVVVGISQYQNSAVPSLRFADKDAEKFAEYLRSARGGKLPDDQLLVLTNEKATTESIRRGIGSLLTEKAGPNDTIIFFIAGHGTVASTGRDPVTGEPQNQGFILTYLSDLADSGLPMQEIRDVMRRSLGKVGRVLVYVDVCRSGKIGVITEKNVIIEFVEASLRDEQGRLSTLMASQPNEYAFENQAFGGGHGAFTYSLLRGLNGAGGGEKDGVVTSGELIRFLQNEVSDATWDHQHPDRLNFLADRTPLASLDKPGLGDIGGFVKLPESVARALSRGVRGGLSPHAGQADETPRPAPEESMKSFEQALQSLPDDPNGAFAILDRLRRDPAFPPDRVPALEDRLRVRLEDLGQDVLIRYLRGDQLRYPQTVRDFVDCAGYFRAALRIAPAARLDESRADFCEGRALVFRKDYKPAIDLLEQAVRLDPTRPYAYNALGIAYLEWASFIRAEQELLDASRRAPYWAYPLHNLALLYAEQGAYDKAIRAYRQAMSRAPGYSYVPYNLAVLYQRLNRLDDAIAMYNQAADAATRSCNAQRGAPCRERAAAYNGLATLYAAQRRSRKAQTYYRKALLDDPQLPAARHNLAQLLAAHSRTAAQAEPLWQTNVNLDPPFAPSLLSLAEYQARTHRTAEALAEAEHGLISQPDDAILLEQKGDALRQLNRKPEAALVWQQALRVSAEPEQRKRLNRALKDR